MDTSPGRMAGVMNDLCRGQMNLIRESAIESVPPIAGPGQETASRQSDSCRKRLTRVGGAAEGAEAGCKAGGVPASRVW